MKIDLEKVKEFAIDAHSGQVRKSDKVKPMVIHPINVANILKEYGCDQNVIAAGYLHDVVEDTKYTLLDIKELFGDDVCLLVSDASEPDKSLSWEERKKETIEHVKTLDLRHKRLICADKISNLEDLKLLFEINQKEDFSSFKRGFEEQKWYYTSVYESLIFNEDENDPMFIRLKSLIDYVFNKKRDDEFVKNTIFKDKESLYKTLNLLHYKKEEIYKLKTILDEDKPYIIEFTGTPRTGKTTIINNLYDFFSKKGFKVEIIEEFTTSSKYKNEIYSNIKNFDKKEINEIIPKYSYEELTNKIKSNPDIIIVDRSLVDRLIWEDRLYNKNGITNLEYEMYKNQYLPLIKDTFDIIISTYASSLISLIRDYDYYLSLEKRKFLNLDNLDEYNNSLLNIYKLCNKENINMLIFNTEDKSIRDVSIDICNKILDDMKLKLIDSLQKKYKYVREKKL